MIIFQMFAKKNRKQVNLKIIEFRVQKDRLMVKVKTLKKLIMMIYLVKTISGKSIKRSSWLGKRLRN